MRNTRCMYAYVCIYIIIYVHIAIHVNIMQVFNYFIQMHNRYCYDNINEITQTETAHTCVYVCII